ncbi:hypothetical protein [Hamadaea tsunoensis]|uniref:hypothetical protein n=1 Tax=Hamadaea tsunoensis TaxID=53368 RepID=UPI000425D33F|nr:hypothetical protein [Hamadaea tsunoensis]
MRHRVLALAGLLPLVIAAVVVASAPAQASGFLVTCGGNQTTTYNPGLTDTPRTLVRSGQNNHTPCVATVSPFAFSGSTSFTSTSTLSCLSLTAANTGVDVITWSFGATSTFAYDRTVTIAEGQTVVTLDGTVTSGVFAGAHATETITSVALDLLDCATATGITSTYGISELIIA